MIARVHRGLCRRRGEFGFDRRMPESRAWLGAIAQLGERVLCKHEVVGSIPSGSTIFAAAPDAHYASAICWRFGCPLCIRAVLALRMPAWQLRLMALGLPARQPQKYP
jgi:hypothetical protein